MATTTSRKRPAPTTTTPRHLWLAGLGFAVLARREGLAALQRATALPGEVSRQAAQSRADAFTRLDTLRQRLFAAAGTLRAQAEARLSPWLPGADARKPAKRKATKKAAGRRLAAGRRQAEARVRKARRA